LPSLLGVACPRRPVAFYLFGTEAAYRKYLAERLPETPFRRSLYVCGSGCGMVFAQRSPALANDLRHESTHAALHALWAEVPLWLDEGMAEYCEAAPASRVGGNPWLAQVAAAARDRRVPRLDLLESKRRAERWVDADYRAAWAWVHFLLNGPPEAREEFRRYCADWDRYDRSRRRARADDGPAGATKTGAVAGIAASGTHRHETVVADPVAQRPNTGQPEPLSQRLARRMPDLDRGFLRHFVGQ
jgi:hypothetical protein